MGEPTIKQLSDSALHRRVVSVPNGAIDGGVIRFIGLEATITDVFVRFISLIMFTSCLPGHVWNRQYNHPISPTAAVGR